MPRPTEGVNEVECPECSAVVEVPPWPLKVIVDRPPTKATSSYRKIEVGHGRFEASYDWWSGDNLALAGAIVGLSLAIAFDLVVAFVLLAIDMSDPRTSLVVFVVMNVATAITWAQLVVVFNDSVLSLNEGVLSCTRGPIPMPWKKTPVVEFASVRSFSVVKRKPNKRDVYYVIATLTSGKEVSVMDGHRNRFAAEFLVRCLERHRLAQPGKALHRELEGHVLSSVAVAEVQEELALPHSERELE